ncbi:MAG: hypothetical protein A2V70_05215, partial [Planctomycetes bacterium RBG_13_63_9]
MSDLDATGQDELLDGLLGDFLDESDQLLRQLTDNLLQLDGWVRSLENDHHQHCDEQLLNEMFRSAHSLKGLSAMLGLDDINNLTHKIENVFDAARKRELTVGSDVVELMFMGVDQLVALIDVLKDPSADPVESDAVLDGIHQLLESAGAARERTSQADAERLLADAPEPSDGEPPPAAEQDRSTEQGCSAELTPETDPFDNVQDENQISDKYLSIFVDEANLALDSITEALLAVEGGGNGERLKTLLVTSHLIKGSAAAVGLHRAAKMAHLMEDLLEGLMDAGGMLTSDMVDAMLKCTDALRQYVAASGSRVTPSDNFGEVARNLLAAASMAAPGTDDSVDPGTDRSSAEAVSNGTDDAAAEMRCEPIAANSCTPSADPVLPAKAKSPESGSRPTETVRVDIERLDYLMNLVGQLVINKAQFFQIGDQLKAVGNRRRSVQRLGKAFSESDKMSRDTLAETRDLVRDLFEAIHQLDRVSNDIQQTLMETRMVPIGPLFTRFKRVIRDITRANGKDIQLVICGEKTELDKRMIDELGDPLIHMVRNSADHGIESPEEREAAGKPRQGTVTLDAFHRGNSIIIRVSDDGKGLDTDGILQKCLKKGILSEADAAKMTPQQINQMIWEPGLTTATKVTEVSGRGMGMDIVRSKIDALSGIVDVESVPGQGTSMTIRLPLTLAILPSLMVDVGGDVFAMPLEAVTEIVTVGKKDLSTVHGLRLARVRGRVISLVTLNDVFSSPCPEGPAAVGQLDEITLVVVGDECREIGLAVDRVIGEEDVVIKSLA